MQKTGNRQIKIQMQYDRIGNRKNRKVYKAVLYILFVIIQCTWGIIQTLVGAIIFAINYSGNEHLFYNGVFVTMWKKKAGFSMGLFIFVPPEPRFYNSEKYKYSADELKERLMIHEYGHSIQSLILGPLYFPVVGLPSSVWSFSPKYQKLRNDRNVSYFDFYAEKWANHLGERVSGKKSMERIDI